MLSSHTYLVAALLEAAVGLDIEQEDETEFGRTPLVEAVWGRHVHVAALLLNHGADPDHCDGHGRAPLILAVEVATDRHSIALRRARGLELVTMLLQARADIDQQRAVHAGALRDHGPGNAAGQRSDDDYDTPLLIATGKGDCACVQLLLAAQADPNLCNEAGCAPLHIASQDGELGIASALLDAGADHSTTDSNGDSPLHDACMFGELELAKLLCSHGALRDGREMNVAREEGNLEVVAWLDDTAERISPLHYLGLSAHIHGTATLLVPAVRARVLLREGGDVHLSRRPGGPTPYSLALASCAGRPALPGSTQMLVLRAAERLDRSAHPRGHRAPDAHRVRTIHITAPEHVRKILLRYTVLTGPWTRVNHLFFPDRQRERARELLWVGRWAFGERHLPMHVWVDHIIKYAVTDAFSSTDAAAMQRLMTDVDNLFRRTA